MAQSSENIAASHLFAEIANAPAVQSLARRLENGGALSFSGVAAPSWPFLAALFKQHFPRRPVVVVTDNLKAQEIFQAGFGNVAEYGCDAFSMVITCSCIIPLTPTLSPKGEREHKLLFFPEWEVFPHEGKLPHADVISDRLQTLVALGEKPFIPTRESATSQEPSALPQVLECASPLALWKAVEPLKAAEDCRSPRRKRVTKVNSRRMRTVVWEILDQIPMVDGAARRPYQLWYQRHRAAAKNLCARRFPKNARAVCSAATKSRRSV